MPSAIWDGTRAIRWLRANAATYLARLAGRMDLSSFTNSYEVLMEVPLVAGLMFERTEQGSIVCYDLRKK